MSALIKGNGLVYLVLNLYTSCMGHCDLWDYTIRLEVKIAVECQYTLPVQWMKLMFDMVLWWNKSALPSEGKESQQWRMWSWKGHKVGSENHIRNDKTITWALSVSLLQSRRPTCIMAFNIQSLVLSMPENNQSGKILGIYFQLHNSGPFPKTRHVIFYLLSYDSWMSCGIVTLLQVAVAQDSSYFPETSCQNK
jgi:hypothetical protein